MGCCGRTWHGVIKTSVSLMKSYPLLGRGETQIIMNQFGSDQPSARASRGGWREPVAAALQGGAGRLPNSSQASGRLETRKRSWLPMRRALDEAGTRTSQRSALRPSTGPEWAAAVQKRLSSHGHCSPLPWRPASPAPCPAIPEQLPWAPPTRPGA